MKCKISTVCFVLLGVFSTLIVGKYTQTLIFAETSAGKPVKRKAEYASCQVHMKAFDGIFVERIVLKYVIPADASFCELDFVGTIPSSASVFDYEVEIENINVKSRCHQWFLHEDGCVGRHHESGCCRSGSVYRIVCLRLAVPQELSRSRNILVKMRWVRRPELAYSSVYGYKRTYSFPVSQYMVPRLRKGGRGDENTYFVFYADLSNSRGWVVPYRENHMDYNQVRMGVYDVQNCWNKENIVFENEVSIDTRLDVTNFSYDGHQILELSVLPGKEMIRNALSLCKEIVFVIDNSSSMKTKKWQRISHLHCPKSDYDADRHGQGHQFAGQCYHVQRCIYRQ